MKDHLIVSLDDDLAIGHVIRPSGMFHRMCDIEVVDVLHAEVVHVV